MKILVYHIVELCEFFRKRFNVTIQTYNLYVSDFIPVEDDVNNVTETEFQNNLDYNCFHGLYFIFDVTTLVRFHPTLQTFLTLTIAINISIIAFDFFV